jgi:hypothetical protein
MNTLRNLIILLVGVAILGGCDKPSEPVEKPRGTISLERAHEMFAAYQARFDALTAFRGGKEDARYGWHSLEYYKKYIAYLEYESKKANIEVSGLRVYYVAYPNDDKSGRQKDFQTYIFVPTYYDKKSDSHIAFDPLYLDKNGSPLPVHDIITKGADRRSTGKVSMILTGGQSGDGSVGNMAQMCEPNCGSNQ